MDDVTTLVLEKLATLERKIDTLTLSGCAKAQVHDAIEKNQSEIFNRLGVVERAQAEGKGKMAVACSVLGALSVFVLQWIGKHMP